MFKNNNFGMALRSIIATLSIGCLVATVITGCGKGKQGENGGSSTAELDPNEIIYVSEYIPLEKGSSDEVLDLYGAEIVGDKLAVVKQTEGDAMGSCLVYYDIKTGKKTEEIKFTGLEELVDSIQIPDKYKETAVSGTTLTHAIKLNDGKYAAILSAYWYTEDENGDYENSQYFAIFDSTGKLEKKESIDFSSLFGGDDSYPDHMISDNNGNIIVSCSSWSDSGSKFALLRLDKDLNIIDSNLNGDIEMIENFCTAADGIVYAMYENHDWQPKLSQINLDTLNFEKDIQIPQNIDGMRYAAFDGEKMIIATYDKLISLNPADGSTEDILKFKDVDVKESSVSCITKIGDDLYVVVNDGESESSDIVKLTPKMRKDVTERKEIVLASLYDDYDLNSLVIEFNKAHPDIHITLKNYYSWENADADVEDARKTMINDITGNNPPDLVNLNEINVRDFVKQGVLEDLTALADQSAGINLDDYNESVLNCFRVDGTLVSIPRSYYLRTLAVNKEDFGDKRGWTLSEMIEYDKAHPNGSITSFTDRYGLMNMCLYDNIDSFINWETGECRFESDEFKQLLEYIASYPESYNYDSITSYKPAEEIANGKILSFEASIYDLQSIQQYDDYLFAGKADFIGYPTMDGKPTAIIQPYTSVAICKKSGNKDIAWKFIESVLATPHSERDALPANEKEMKKLIDEELSKAGKQSNSSISWGDGESYDFHYATQDEIDEFKKILSEARISRADSQLVSIIEEETGSFFAGQKSVDECAKIIQSRISIYVTENR